MDGFGGTIPGLSIAERDLMGLPLAALLARDQIPGMLSVRKFGERAAITTAAPQDIWNGAATAYPWQTVASPIRVRAGGNAADTAAGAGARKVVVQGLLDGCVITPPVEIVTAGAAASAPTALSYFRTFRAYVTDAGTYGGANVGDIIIETTAGVEVMRITAGDAQTNMTMWTMPAGYEGVAVQAEIGASSKNDVADFEFLVRPNADVVAAPFDAARIVNQWIGVSGGFTSSSAFSQVNIDEKTDLWVRAGLASAPGTADTFFWYSILYWPKTA